MPTARLMLETTPSEHAFDTEALVRGIEACFDCAQTCTACADACLGEPAVTDMVTCIRRDLDCADVCAATGRLLSRQTAYDPALSRAQLRACAEACQVCAEECERHASTHEHCRVCSEVCRRCEEACEGLLAAA